MKTILKNVTLLPEHGYGNTPLFVTVEDKRIAAIDTTEPDITDAEAARREQQVGDAMENYMRAYLARKKGAR